MNRYSGKYENYNHKGNFSFTGIEQNINTELSMCAKKKSLGRVLLQPRSIHHIFLN
jgi:hypothetical protein